MIRTLLTLILVFSFLDFKGQAPTRINTIISDGYDDCHDLLIKPSGDFYTTGQIEYTASFDGYHLSSNGSHDIFLARYDSLGNLIWAKHAGGTDGDIGYSIDVDHEGSVFITGEFETVSDFGGISKTAQGSNNMFIAKYDSTGHSLWVKSIGTNSGSTIGYALACDANGNVYAAGTTRAKAYYNGSTLFTSRGSEDIILIKFNPDGDKMWHKQIGGSDSDEGFGLAVLGEYVYLTGSFEGSARFNSSVTLDSDGDKDFFLAKYDTLGSLQWAVSGGGSGDDIGQDVAINSNGRIVCTGEFRGHASFGSNSVSSDGSSDMFVAAYDDNGNNLWVRSGGGNNIDFGNRITADLFGNVFVGGTFMDDATFDTVIVSSNGEEDAFFSSYDSSGNFRFIKAFGGPDHDRGHGSGSDAYGNLFFSGEFWDHIDFDGVNVNGSLMYDAFIVRYNKINCDISIDTAIINNVSCIGCNDGAINLSITGGTSPYTFSWMDGYNSEDRFNIPVGNYSLCISDQNGCNLCDTFDVSLSVNGIEENRYVTLINAYPNPVESIVSIHFNDNLSTENFLVELNDQLGKEVISVPVTAADLNLAMNEYASGFYHLKVVDKKSGQVVRNIPLILQKKD